MKKPVSWYEHTVYEPNVRAAIEKVESIVMTMLEKTSKDVLKKLDAL
jgi:hypothetical protein